MEILCTNDGKMVFTTSLVIAKGCGVEHRAVLQLIKTHSSTKTLSTFQMRKY